MYQDKTLCEYDYDAWGNCVVTKYDLTPDEDWIVDNNPFRWKGYYWDKESGFYYIGGSYYDPVLMQFIEAVSPSMLIYSCGEVGGLNNYGLTSDNPLTCPPSCDNIAGSGSGGSSSGWTATWGNSEGPWYNWKGSIFRAEKGNFSISAGVAEFSSSGFTAKVVEATYNTSIGDFSLSAGVVSFGALNWDPLSGLEIINIQVDLLRLDYAYNDNIGAFATLGTATAYFGFDYKEGIGIEVKAAVATGGIQIGFITLEGYVGGAGVTAMYKDGTITLGFVPGIGGSISINVIGAVESLSKGKKYFQDFFKR